MEQNFQSYPPEFKNHSKKGKPPNPNSNIESTHNESFRNDVSNLLADSFQNQFKHHFNKIKRPNPLNHVFIVKALLSEK